MTAVSVGVWMLLLVAAYATQPLPHTRIYERYLFYFIPLLVLGLLVWIEHGIPRPRRASLVVVGAAALPLTLPFADIGSPDSGVLTAALSLVPWAVATAGFDSVLPAYLGTAAFLAWCGWLFLSTTRPRTAYLPTLVLAFFVLMGLVVTSTHLLLSSRSNRLGVGSSTPDWVDRRVGRDADVAVIWSGTAAGGWRSGYPVWDGVFFNRSLRTVYTLRGDLGLLESTRLELRGTMALDGGEPVRAEYVVADPLTKVAGTEIAGDPRTGMALYRVDGPLHVRLERLHAGQQQP